MRSQSCLHERFREVAREFPDRVAVSVGDEHVRYAELADSAESVAAALAQSGVRPGERVGLCCARGVPLIAGMLGILMAGGSYVPIDPGYPDTRIRLLVEDSGVRLVLADEAGRIALPRTDAEVVDLAAAAGAGPAAVRAEVAADSDRIAYVIYTSGSTGVPKGVQISHANAVRLFDSTAHWFGFDEYDVWTLFHSPSFDFSVWEIWGALLHGGRLVVVGPDVAANPLLFLDVLRTERVTVLNQTPSAFRLLAAVGCDRTGADLALRAIVFGGERLDVTLLRDWIATHGDERPQLVNMYGITETTVHVTYRRIRSADLAAAHRSPIGEPIPDLSVTIRDEHGEVVPAGAAGEIWVAGAGVSPGYLNRPELDAERFVTVDGQRAYRSGDLGVVDGGELVHCGRIDDQIKVRGYRIEPFEVEAAMLTHPDVAAAIVASRDFGAGDIRLVAYVEPVPGRDEELGARLREHAATQLPPHLRPSDYVAVEHIPITAQGKADRNALSALTPKAPTAADPQRRAAPVG